ncbi:MAG TPA: hypothetical protein VJQ47_09175 [Steroidobacteraceae bacterium]|nr:hypothetical protein [Steroidobacteraceae bacterium]
MKPIAETLRKPAIELRLVTANQPKEIGVVLFARQRLLHEMARARLQL